MGQIKAKNIEREVNKILIENGIDGNKVNVFVSDNRKREEENFIKLFQHQRDIIANCQPSTAKIFMYMLYTSMYGNFIEIDISQIAVINRMSEISVKRAIKELKEMDVIFIDKDLNDKRRNTYCINPMIAWKGNASDRVKSIDRRNEQLKIDFPKE